MDHLDKVKRMRVADKDVQGLKVAYEVRQFLRTACFRRASSTLLIIHRKRLLS